MGWQSISRSRRHVVSDMSSVWEKGASGNLLNIQLTRQSTTRQHTIQRMPGPSCQLRTTTTSGRHGHCRAGIVLDSVRLAGTPHNILLCQTDEVHLSQLCVLELERPYRHSLP